MVCKLFEEKNHLCVSRAIEVSLKFVAIYKHFHFSCILLLSATDWKLAN